MKFARSVWILLIVGIAVRCVAVNQPLIDAHLIRQCQTAAATKSLIEEPGFHVSSKIPWLGDFDAHYILELPIYNYLTIGVHFVTHNLDLSGKLTSILLWAAGFLCLQFIWRRLLNAEEMFWANLLFVVAPLSVFYGQAFMPEMLVQFFAFAFVLLILRYDENSTLGRWWACVVVGAVGLTVKLPEVAHLYFILGFLIIRRDRWRAFLKPRYWLAAAITLVALKAWGSYADSVNSVYLPEWTSSENLRRFIGTFESRFHFRPWAIACLYVAAFIVPGPAAMATVYGLWISLRESKRNLLAVWLVSIGLFYVVWFGSAATGQSYYNLPALAPLCALFGIGLSALLAWPLMMRWRRTMAAATILLVVVPVMPACSYLFRQDRQVLSAAGWVKENTQPNEVILFRPNHRWDFIDYPYNPVLAYYAQRPTFVWTKNTPEIFRRAALERSHYVIVTLPQGVPTGLIGYLNKRLRAHTTLPEPTDWLKEAGFQLVTKQSGFEIFRRE